MLQRQKLTKTSRPKDSHLVTNTVYHSPHLFSSQGSALIMWLVSLCLLPAALWGVWLYGWHALRVITLCIFACLVSETICNLLSGRDKKRLYQNYYHTIEWTVIDGSAFVTGLLLGMNLPSLVPWYVPIFGGMFAIFVGKWSFGGLGANWANPALVGRAFVFFSFSDEMANWPQPSCVWQDQTLQYFNAISSASPLTVFKVGLDSHRVGVEHSALETWGATMQFSTANESLTNLFFGFHGGSIGEASSLLLILGALVLLSLNIIGWHIPLAFISSFALLTWVFGGLRQGFGLFHGEVLFHLFSGGLMLGAWFMATDYAGCPKMPLGKLIFALGCGVLSFLARFYGSYPEGIMLAILFMNVWTPTLDIVIQPCVFGSGKQGGWQQRWREERQHKRILKQPYY